MAVRVGKLNGKNLNYLDHDSSSTDYALLNSGVVEGMQVTTNSVGIGRALLITKRTNIIPNQKFGIHLEVTSVHMIDTSGTKKVWIAIDPQYIEDGTLATNGLGMGIATIQTGASYPADDSYYIPLASITSGVITDERPMLSMKPVRRKNLTPNRVIVTNSSGNEIEMMIEQGKYLTTNSSGEFVQVSPSVDIAALPSKSAPVRLDKTIISDNEDGGINKEIALGSIEATMSHFGDGSDGNVTISGTVTLTRDMFYDNLTLTDGSILKTNGYRVYVNGTLSRPGTGYMDTSGGDGGIGGNGFNGPANPGGTAGVPAYTSGTLPIPFAGRPGDSDQPTSNNNGVSTSRGLIYSNGVAGGTSGDGTDNTSTTVPGRAAAPGGLFTPSSNRLRTLQHLQHLLDITTVIATCELAPSSAGGESSTSSFCGRGGGSGANGGAIYIAARKVVIGGISAVFRSRGGQGGAGGNGDAFSTTYRGGGGGGGSGGQGGLVAAILGSCNVDITLYIDVSGGLPGAGGLASPANPTRYATNGGAGLAGNPGRIVIYQFA